MLRHLALVLGLVGCGKDAAPPEAVKEPPKTAVVAPPAEKPPEPTPTPTPTPVPVADVPPGTPPADGKYERVIVDGVTVPMINVMDGGKTILVDTDGKKPRSWEEQYKQKRVTVTGHYDVHKTDANKSGKFDDDQIDKEGLWVIDAKGNLVKK